jgi:hypothetical protein
MMSYFVRMSAGVIVLGILLGASGCGGGVEDPFADRVKLTGTMNLEGMPVKWGSLILRGAKKEDTQEQAVDSLVVTDGKFATSEGSPGTTAGQNEAQVIIYAEAPPVINEEEGSDYVPKVTGYWSGPVTVEADKPLVIDLKMSDLKKSLE